MWVHGLFDGMHQRQCDGVFVVRQFGCFQAAHAVFSADAAIVARHGVENQCVDVRFLTMEKDTGVFRLGRLHVVVQVTVAQVAKVHQANAGDLAPQQRVGLGAERGNARNGNADVVFDVEAFFGLRQRNAFADVPQTVGLGDAFGHHGIAHPALFKSCFQQAFKLCTGVGFRFAVAVFQ